MKYTNDICWIINTYYVPLEHDIPHSENTRYERKRDRGSVSLMSVVFFSEMLKYYQWSPFILLFMALCFYFPRMLWRSLNNRSGLDIEKLVDEAMKQEQQDNPSEGREKTINFIVHSLQFYIENRYRTPGPHNQRRSLPQKFWYYFTFWRHRHLSAYLVVLFTFVKLLFLVNSVVQIFLLNAFLGNDYHLFGIEVVSKFLRGLDWGESKRFPRVTLCDFHIREVGIVHRYTVQCVLPINLFNEKIFLILWFWILILAAFNSGDFISWLLRVFRVDGRTAYVRRKLAMMGVLAAKDDDEHQNEKRNAKRFVRNYLQEDGCFALRLLARNGQDIIVGEVIERLYRHYCDEISNGHINNDHPLSSEENSARTTFQPLPASRSSKIDMPSNDHERRRFMK